MGLFIFSYKENSNLTALLITGQTKVKECSISFSNTKYTSRKEIKKKLKKNRKTNKANTKPKTKTQKHPKGGSPTDPKQIYRAKARAENTAKRRKG